MDRAFAVHADSRGFDSHQLNMSNDFPDPIDQDIRTQCALSWEIVVSEWRSVIAMLLNVGGDVRFINRQNCVHVRAKILQTQRGRTHGARYSRPWFRTAEPLGERIYENRIKTTVQHSDKHSFYDRTVTCVEV